MIFFKVILSEDEILALDDYVYSRLGYVGHDGIPDETMHRLIHLVSTLAQDIRINREIKGDEVNDATH